MSNSEILKWLKDLREKYLIMNAPAKYSKYIDKLIHMLEEQSNRSGKDDRYKDGYQTGFEEGYEIGFRDATREVRD